MKNKRTLAYTVCLALSALLLLWFAVQMLLFLFETAENHYSFGEAVKKLLLFAMQAAEPLAVLVLSVVLSAVGIKLSATSGQKKLARALFIAEMILLALYALILLSMFVVFPEELAGRMGG
jgi:hypothetical protein